MKVSTKSSKFTNVYKPHLTITSSYWHTAEPEVVYRCIYIPHVVRMQSQIYKLHKSRVEMWDRAHSIWLIELRPHLWMRIIQQTISVNILYAKKNHRALRQYLLGAIYHFVFSYIFVYRIKDQQSGFCGFRFHHESRLLSLFAWQNMMRFITLKCNNTNNNKLQLRRY